MKTLGEEQELNGRDQKLNKKAKIAGVTMAVKDRDDVTEKTKEARMNLSKSRPHSSLIQEPRDDIIAS